VETITYKKEWVDKEVNSLHFYESKYANPSHMPIGNHDTRVAAKLGDYNITGEMVDQLDAPVEYKTSEEEQAIIGENSANTLGQNGYSPLRL